MSSALTTNGADTVTVISITVAIKALNPLFISLFIFLTSLNSHKTQGFYDNLKLYIKGWHAGIQTSTENLEIDLSLVLLYNFSRLFLVNPTKAALLFALFIFAY